MSHTNSTANYQLPQFLGTDKPAWLTDVNQAYADIDTAMKANEVSAGQANALATQNSSAISTMSGQISTLSTKVTALETAQPTDEAQIETNRQNIATNAQNIVEIDNRLGHTSIASIGDGTVTGAIADLDARPSVSDADDVTYDNTDSGLTATNVQDAIDELASGGITETIRYDATSEYIQCKDGNGWFNWQKARRAIWDAITNSSAISTVTYTSLSAGPIVSLVNNQLNIKATNNTGGSAYVPTRAEDYTVHYTASGNCTSASIIVGYCDSFSGGAPGNAVELGRIALNTSGTLSGSATVPAGKYFFVTVGGSGASGEVTFSELYGN